MSRRRKPPSRRPGDRVHHDRTRTRAPYPLRDQPPPYDGYRDWITVPAAAADLAEHPAMRDPELDDEAKATLEAAWRLGPRYRGAVPMAALVLDAQIREGTINLAITGEPDQFRPMPVAEFAASLSDPAFIAGVLERYPWPTADGPDPALTSIDVAAFQLHALHAHGLMVLDDHYVVNLAIPPLRPGREWTVSGTHPDWEWRFRAFLDAGRDDHG